MCCPEIFQDVYREKGNVSQTPQNTLIHAQNIQSDREGFYVLGNSTPIATGSKRFVEIDYEIAPLQNRYFQSGEVAAA